MSDPTDLTAAPLAIGRYQVTDRLGQGGMGIVYLARDPFLERFVAIKLMRSGFDSSDLRERFVREARAVASLRHPSIVTLYEYGDHHGQPFIVMEYVTGKTLAELIEAGTPMSLARRLQLIEDLCRGLEHAHKAGIIHRDIKPANIMVDSEGTLKVLDFGIAKLGHAALTHISALVGTPRYMSPEQIAGKAVTRRSDIFSVGLVAYELLAFRAAFAIGNQFGVMDAILNAEPTPLSQHVPDLDPRIVRMVDKALQKDPDRRYQDLAQMRRDVARIRVELANPESTVGTVLVKPAIQLEELGRRREQQIAANLENAERAFEQGDYDAALAACEDVLILDPQSRRGMEGLQRAQAALVERQALAHLGVARDHFAKDELTAAESALRAAFELVPALREGVDLQDQVGAARQERDERSHALHLAIDRARIRLSEGAFQSALNAAEEALSFAPLDPEARRLKAQALVALEEDRRQRELDRRAHVSVDEAGRLAARDRYDDALRVLEDDAVAAHALVRDARGRIAFARDEFERLKSAAAARAEAARVDVGRAEAIRVQAARSAEASRIAAEREEAARAEAARLAAGAARLQAIEASRQKAVAAAAKLDADRRQAERAAEQRRASEHSTLILSASDSANLGTNLQEPTAVQTDPPSFTPNSPGTPAGSEPKLAQRPHGVLALDDSPGFLPGPVRLRRPKPPRRPVRFLDTDGSDRGAREWFADRLFVTAKHGHDTVGFGLSITTHVIFIVAIVVALLTQQITPTAPARPNPITMIALATPPPVSVETTPAKPAPAKPARPSKAAEPSLQPVVSRPAAAAPIEAPASLPTVDTPPRTPAPPPLVAVEPPKPDPPPPIVGRDPGLISEVPVTDFDQEAEVIKKVLPKVPAGASGRIRVEVTVVSTGAVSRVKILDRSDYDAAIVAAAQQCLFRPAKRRGRPVAVVAVLEFQLETNR